LREGVALLTLNRPEKLNALCYALVDRLMGLLDAIEDDPAIRAVILTGAAAPSRPGRTSRSFPKACVRGQMSPCAPSCAAARR